MMDGSRQLGASPGWVFAFAREGGGEFMAGRTGVGLSCADVSQAPRAAPGHWGMGRPKGEVGQGGKES